MIILAAAITYLTFCLPDATTCQKATYECANAWVPPDVRDCKPTGEVVIVDNL
jgi:hypothetical protein